MPMKPVERRASRDGRSWLRLAVVAVLCLPVGETGRPRALAGPPAEPAATAAAPVLTGVFPPGTVAGTTTRWSVTGRGLGRVERFLVSGEGVSIVPAGPGSDGRISATVRVALGAMPGFREMRVDGPAGVSNVMLFRVDSLPQLVESEPNDDPAHGNALALGLAAAGVLEARGVDHFQVGGRQGGTMVVEVEARRLGTPIVPVVTLLSPAGAALLQTGETRGLEGDCRAVFRFPADGRYVIQVRDALYRGGPDAGYRVRVTASPLATGLFPLGGRAGETIEVTASGGSLTGPRRQIVTLPATPGQLVEPGPFEGPGGPVLVPQRLVAGEGPEVLEALPESGGGSSTTRLPLGTTGNGRIDRPGEVDGYLVPARRGDRIEVAVQAASLGSWLDSVVTVRDARGAVLAENDDPPGPGSPLGSSRPAGAALAPRDSLLEYVAAEDGTLRVEVGDRFGDGGPEYAYRLTVGPARPDFTVEFLPFPAPGTGMLNEDAEAAGRALEPAPEGVLNLAPGTTGLVRVAVAPRGRIGPITLHALGLPAGVTADPVSVRPPPGRGRQAAGVAQVPVLNTTMSLHVAAEAKPALGELRIVATAARPDGTTISRQATTSVALSAGLPGGAASRPVVRELRALPIKVRAVPSRRP